MSVSVLRDQALIDRFGRNLRCARRERGLSQAQLAQESGLAVTEISRIERGIREVRLTTLMRLVDALGASPHELLSGLTLPVTATQSKKAAQQAADAR